MSEWKVDLGVVVTAESAREAAAICAAMLKIGAEFMPIKPVFVGVHGNGDQAPPESETAANVFGRIMAAPDV
jgi:hypothetical protein